MGLISITVPFVMTFYLYGLNFENSHDNVPNYFYFVFAAGFLVYRIFDEMDGKQARKTGTSSPLGMLFDHGVDGFSIWFIMLSTLKLASCGDTSLSLFFFSACIAMFYFPILEEYYVGGIFFGKCNPVTDLGVLAIGFYIYMGFNGNTLITMTLIKQNVLWSGSPTLRLIDCFMFLSFGIVFINNSIA